MEIVKEMRAAAGATPILVHANAGLPKTGQRRGRFPESPEEMAARVKAVVEAGANIIGGCCGTTPAHIQAIRKAVDGLASVSKVPFPCESSLPRSGHAVLEAGGYLHGCPARFARAEIEFWKDEPLRALSLVPQGGPKPEAGLWLRGMVQTRPGMPRTRSPEEAGALKRE